MLGKLETRVEVDDKLLCRQGNIFFKSDMVWIYQDLAVSIHVVYALKRGQIKINGVK